MLEISTLDELDEESRKLTKAVVVEIEVNCQTKTKKVGSTRWWNPELGQSRRRVRALFRQANRWGNWETYRKSLTEYNMAIRGAKRCSWSIFFSGLIKVHETSRLIKVLSRDIVCSPGCVRRAV